MLPATVEGRAPWSRGSAPRRRGDGGGGAGGDAGIAARGGAALIAPSSVQHGGDAVTALNQACQPLVIVPFIGRTLWRDASRRVAHGSSSPSPSPSRALNSTHYSRCRLPRRDAVRFYCRRCLISHHFMGHYAHFDVKPAETSFR